MPQKWAAIECDQQMSLEMEEASLDTIGLSWPWDAHMIVLIYYLILSHYSFWNYREPKS